MSKRCSLLLFLQVALRSSYHVVSAGLCLGGSDLFASVRENSPAGQFISDLSITAEPGPNGVRLCLSGADGDWFYIEGRTIRLNSSISRVLDREVQGAVLMAELTCYEDNVIQSQMRIFVEILNENDNRPKFVEETILQFRISELTAVNSVVFSVKAVDADGDVIRYIIDESSSGAAFFRIDLPNSGNVVLNRALDYESRAELQLIVWAQEVNTADKFNTSAVLRVNVEDGDDQYPHFLPCTPFPAGLPVCISPAYTANITHTQQDEVLTFSPGPIRAEDGDRGINTRLTFSILSGEDHGRFVINNRTGDITILRPVNPPRQTSNFTLIVMVCQVNDPFKYSIASVLIRVLSENRFPPVFNRTTFKGFIIQSSSPASIVTTYGNQVLQVQVSDRDFSDGPNPNIQYSLLPPSGLFQVTQGGVLIARTDHLHAFDRHILQVVARDEESGEEVSASVDVEVLQRGQSVPRGAFREQQMFGDVDGRLAGGVVAMLLLLFFSLFLFLLLRKKKQRNADENEAGDFGKHPNVVTSNRPVFSIEEYESSSQTRSFHGKRGVYTRKHSLLPPPSSSSNIRGPGGRFRSDLLPVTEKPEGPPEGTIQRPGRTGPAPESCDDITVVTPDPLHRRHETNKSDDANRSEVEQPIRAQK